MAAQVLELNRKIKAQFKIPILKGVRNIIYTKQQNGKLNAIYDTMTLSQLKTLTAENLPVRWVIRKVEAGVGWQESSFSK